MAGQLVFRYRQSGVSLQHVTNARWCRWFAGGLAIAVCAIAATGCGSGGGGGRDGCASFRFDSAGWKRNPTPSGELSLRQRIADRAITCRFFSGMSRREVVKLLGRPYGDSTERVLVWGIGSERGPIKLDAEYLRLELDAKGRVRRASTASA